MCQFCIYLITYEGKICIENHPLVEIDTEFKFNPYNSFESMY